MKDYFEAPDECWECPVCAMRLSSRVLLALHEADFHPAPKPFGPPHYQLTPEPIEAIEGWGLGYNLGSAVSYLARCGKKEGATKEDDLRKAISFLTRELKGTWT